MDARTLRVLEFEKVRQMLVDCATSTIGKELAGSLEPSCNFSEVTTWQAETTEGKTLLRFEPNVPLGGIRDIRPSLHKAEIGGILDAGELLEVADTLRAGRRLKNFLLERREQYPLLAEWAQQITLCAQLEAKIQGCILENGEISDAASPDLAKIRKQIKTTQVKIRERLESIIRGSEYQKYLQEALITIRGDRYVIPVKQEARAHFPGIIHDQSASGATLFIEPMSIVEANNELRQLMLAEQHEITRVLQDCTHAVAREAGKLKLNLEALGHLDFVFAKARLSYDLRAGEPLINQKGQIEIVKGRHPLLQGEVVPVDLHLGKSFDTLVITGPNTGGKTVTLKTVGLFVLMAQAGLHVPAEPGTELSIFRHVFADIGDEQSIEQSLSTFSAHMTNIVRIFEQIDDRTLLLMDELGAGTDPTEGAALAMAILEYLHSRGVKTLATTHYSELKTFAYMCTRVENASVEFDLETLRPTYRLLIGLPGKSNAFEIARRLGLSSAVVDRARSFLTREQVQIGDLIQTLEEKRRQAENERREIHELQQSLSALKQEYEHAKAEIKRRETEMLQKARQEAVNLVKQARQEAEEIIRRLRELSQQEARNLKECELQEARERLKDLREKLEEGSETAEPGIPDTAPENLKVGDAVFLTNLQQKGQVVAEPNAHGEVVVQLGMMRITVPLSQCRKIEQFREEKPKSNNIYLSLARAQNIPRELDLRGLNIEDASSKIEKYLDDAYLAGISTVYLIHGKGTGILRQGVRAFLSEYPYVESFRPGGPGEGGDGVTVVELKR